MNALVDFRHEWYLSIVKDILKHKSYFFYLILANTNLNSRRKPSNSTSIILKQSARPNLCPPNSPQGFKENKSECFLDHSREKFVHS